MVEKPSLEALVSGQAVLFVGAGFSIGATNQSGKPIHSGVSLADELLTIAKVADRRRYNLEMAADEYAERLGEDALISYLYNNFKAKTVTSIQSTIVNQPWRRIYTSNYDDVVELCAAATAKPLNVKEVVDKVEAPPPGITQLLHIYGNLARLSREEFRSSFLLNERQRDQGTFTRSAWFRRFSEDLISSSAAIFVGYSADDVDIRRLLGLLPQGVFSKVWFVDLPTLQPVIRRRLEQFGTVWAEGAVGLSSLLQQPRLTVPATAHPRLPSVVEKIAFSLPSPTPSDRDIQLMLLGGVLSPGKLGEADLKGDDAAYTVRRNENATRRAESVHRRPVLVHSDVGNGKSVFLSQLALAKNVAGYEVYSILREPERLEPVIEFFAAVDRKSVVILDDLLRFPRLLPLLVGIENGNLEIFASVRSNVRESGRPLIEARFSGQTFTEIDLNSSSRPELDRIRRYLNHNSLWGPSAELSEAEKADIIARKCGGQLRDVILFLFEDGALHRRIAEVVAGIMDLDVPTVRLFILSALLTLAGFEGYNKLYISGELADFDGSVEDLNAALTRRSLQGLVDLDRGEVVFKSAIVAEFFLRRHVKPKDILDTALLALRNVDRYFADEVESERLSRSLLKFSLYNKIVDSSEFESLISGFFHDARVLRIAQDDPLFNVQRSISAMHFGYFDIADRYIETAYGLAKKRRAFDTYQIDTHKARVALFVTIKEGFSIDLVREGNAQRLLEGVLDRRQDDLYHPLSVMRLYADIYSKWGATLVGADLENFSKILARASKRVSSFPNHLRSRYSAINSVEQGLSKTRREVDTRVAEQRRRGKAN